MERNGQILEAVESLLGPSEYEVVDIDTVGSKRGLVVRIFIDKPDGVTLEDCARLTRAIEDHFESRDTLPGRYVLEVSSPGIDRPLRKPADFGRFAGEAAKVTTFEKIDGKHNHTGVLEGYDKDKDAVLLRDEEGVLLTIPRGAIKKAHLHRDPWGGRR